MSFLALLISLLSFFSLNAVAAHEAIVGGLPATTKQYPYQVSLQHLGQHVCGGSILSETFVLTAAHCIHQYPNNLTIRAGSSTVGRDGIIYNLSKIAQHPKFNPTTGDYDVAVITLRSDLTLGASIAINSAKLEPGRNCTATGWGFERENGKLSDELQAVELETILWEECRKDYQAIVPVTDRMMCTYSPDKDTCQGDSGGPLVYNGVQVGIVGFGYGCARRGYPGVYTDVANEEIHRFIVEGMEKPGSLQPSVSSPVDSSMVPSSMMPSSTVQSTTHQLSTQQSTAQPSTTLQSTTLHMSTTHQAASEQSGVQQPGSCHPKNK